MESIAAKLIQNAMYLLTLCFLFDIVLFLPQRWQKQAIYLYSAFIILIGIAIMSTPFFFSDGILIDTRSILITLTALHFGTIPTIIVSVVLILFRIYIGGIATFSGVLIIITAAVLGIAFNYYRRIKGWHGWLSIYLFSLLVSLCMLLTFLTLPGSLALASIQTLSPFILLIYPIVTVFLNNLMQLQARHRENISAVIEAEDRFRRLIEGAPEAIYIQMDGKFFFANQYAVALFGAQDSEQLIGTPVLERYHPDFHSAIKQRIENLIQNKLPVPVLEQIFLKFDGTPIFVEANAVPYNYKNTIGTMVFARDISEKKQMQQERLGIEAHLRHQQKLEAIGTLAGGVAHEINNPINGIMNYAQLIMDDLPEDSQQITYVNEIIHETERISGIVRDLLQFSRQEKQSHSYACPYDIINQTLSLVRTVIRKDQIVLKLNIDAGLPNIKCRSQQIQQVIMNLLTNARDALNEKYPGFDENKVMELSCCQFDMEDRKWIRIMVRDFGNGIPIEIQEKIFEPFFSTKPKEIGTGLGLAISFGIVKDHHGKFKLETVQDQYSCFIVELPAENGWNL